MDIINNVEVVNSNNFAKDKELFQTLPRDIEIQNWLVNYLSELLEVDIKKIDVVAPFTKYGLDSLTTAGMVSDLSQWIEKEISPDLAYKYSSIQALSAFLAVQND
jgi:acyl carrier protein